MLGPGAALVVLDTPNRLWHLDNHSSFAPFFHWLPDDVALDYARHTPRRCFAEAFEGLDRDAAHTTLARLGRGVSFHDFQLAIGPLETPHVSGEWDHRRTLDETWAHQWDATIDGRYQALLREMMPSLPRPWFESELAFVIRKP